jgi:pimeloyl-ACP methyl ester carboxylesterase
VGTLRSASPPRRRYDRAMAATLPPDVLAWMRAGSFHDVGGRRIFVIDTDHEAAHDDTVLIMHGFPGSSYDWHAVLPLLTSAVRVVSLDLLGFGLSDKPSDASYALVDQADLVETIAQQLGVRRCLIAAHDMGDTVAAELLHRRNHNALRGLQITSCVLTNGSIFIDLAQLSSGQLTLLDLPDAPLDVALPAELLRAGLASTFAIDRPAPVEEIDAMTALVAHNGGDLLLPRLIRYIEERRRRQGRWTAALVDYDGPLIAVWGEQDPIAVVAMTDRLQALRPATEVVRWSDVGHWPSLEAPQRLAGLILSRVATAASAGPRLPGDV